MAEGIVPADADQRQRGSNASDESRARCEPAAVMTGLEQVRAQVGAAGQQARFARFAGVAGEQRAEDASVVGIREPENDAVLVDVVAAVGDRRVAGREHVERHAVVARPAHPRPGHPHGHAALVRRAQAVDEGPPGIALAGVGDRIDAQRAHDGRAAADVVAVRVRVHEQRHLAHAFAS